MPFIEEAVKSFFQTIPPVVKNNSHHGISTIKSDYPKVADDLSRYINHDVTKGQYIALISLAFNLGSYGVITGCPKLLYKLNSGDIEGAALEFLDCDRAGGKRVPGLTRRRQAESKLFSGEE